MSAGSRRILVTGLSTYWGGRLAQALEAFDEVEAVIGVDNEEPHVELERTEYVKVGTQHALLRRVVEAAEIDTVVDTRLVVDSSTTTPAKAHENNVIGTMNILAACSGAGSPVRKVVFKSSAHFYGCEQDDPAFFDESMGRSHRPSTSIERDVVEAEASIGDFAEKNPDVAVTVLRFANVLGPSVRTSHIGLFSLPAVPMILGFDPRYQFVHEDDVVHALEHAVTREVPGVYNVAGDGVLALSEVAGLLGKPYAPILPPWGTGLAAAALRRVGVRIPPEAMNQLRFGRGLDNRRYKVAGFHYQHTSRESGAQARRAPAAQPGGARRAASPTATSARWRSSCAGARTCATPATRRGRRSAATQLVELQRLLAGYRPRRRAPRRSRPVAEEPIRAAGTGRGRGAAAAGRARRSGGALRRPGRRGGDRAARVARGRRSGGPARARARSRPARRGAGRHRLGAGPLRSRATRRASAAAGSSGRPERPRLRRRGIAAAMSP